jgi:hypothetical protein
MEQERRSEMKHMCECITRSARLIEEMLTTVRGEEAGHYYTELHKAAIILMQLRGYPGF